MLQRKSQNKNDFIVPGAFIPQRIQNEKKRQKRRASLVAAAYSILIMGGLVFAAGSYDGIVARLTPQSLIASTPMVVLTSTEPYNVRAHTAGAISELRDEKEFLATVQSFVNARTSFLSIDVPSKSVSYYTQGQLVLSAPIQFLPSSASWKMPQSGLYTVSNKSERQYSALQEVYYPHTLQFAQNYLIHGTPELADGTRATTSDTGVQLLNSDMSTLYELIDAETIVLVRGNTTDESTDTTYVMRGPRLQAGNYLIADVHSGTILLDGRDQNDSVPIASLTKLMTALVVAESYDLEAEVVVPGEEFVNSLVPRLAGISRTTNYNLLQLLLIESSNEAAEVLTKDMGREAFIRKMNQKAAEVGMKQTSFTDPSGIDNGNISSPDDLLLLIQYIYKTYPFIFALSIEESIVRTNRPADFVELDNFNDVPLLNDIVGGKIGETTAAGQTSITLHKMTVAGSDRVVAIIILGSQSRNADVLFLRRYLGERFN